MAIDDDFVKNFKKQIDLLKSLEKAVQDAIGRANEKLDELNRGERIEKVFGTRPEK
ncbi:MAG TPA: hypothetical protein VNY10_11860 [Roseiarcus sp.]|jgi:hypothetical protein|nr:hypothetical protein [Roseiarcus sp.]